MPGINVNLRGLTVDDSYITMLIPGGRLCGGSGKPTGESSNLSPTSLYYCPYLSNKVSVYNDKWQLYSFSELSISLSGLVIADKNYDVFIYYDSASSTLKLELGSAWYGNTQRLMIGLGLELFDGIWCKVADKTRRYIGTIRGIASGQTSDSSYKRFISNYYNKIKRSVLTWNSSSEWSYGTETWRQFNNGTNQTKGEFLLSNPPGYIETVSGMISGSRVESIDTNDKYFAISMALDSIYNKWHPGQIKYKRTSELTTPFLAESSCKYSEQIGIGYHYVTLLEKANATGMNYSYNDNCKGILEFYS